MPAPLPRSYVPAVLSAFRKHPNAAKVAADLGIGHTTVLRILENEGVRRMPPKQAHPRKLNPAQEADVARRYAAGERTRSLGREYKIGAETVRKIAVRSGIPIFARGNRRREFSPEQVAEMARLWREGYSQSEIGVRFRAHQSFISAVLRRAGLAKSDSYYAKAERHGSWKGGRTIAAGGYVRVLVNGSDPMVVMGNNSNYVLEHRLVMARHLGRPLLPTETVHHKNGKRDDNRLENLELWASRHPHGIRVEEAKHCPTCTCGGHS